MSNDQIHGGDLVKSISIENLVNQREAVLERIAKATALLLEANAIAASSGVGFPTVCMSTGYSRHIDHRLTGTYRDDDQGAGFNEAARIAVDIGGWQYLMNESGLRTLMDAKARAEWDKQFNDGGKIPQLTHDNIRRTFADLYHGRGEMFDRGVIEVFRRLSWDYKTNNPFRFGKRIILCGLRYKITGQGKGYGYLNNRVTDELDDLVRCFAVLDGKPEPDHRDTMWSRISKQEREEFRSGPEDELQAEYFSVRWFRNGNGHLTFTRPDLVERMNSILTRHFPGALPHAKGS